MKTYIGISRDHSISMRGLVKMAAQDYNMLVENIVNETKKTNQNTIVSVVECGVSGGYSGGGKINRETVLCPATSLKPIKNYVASGGSTPLFDSVGDLIEQFSNVPDKNDPNVAFLIMVITDGEENSSVFWRTRLKTEIEKLQSTGKWTFVFRVPRGYKQSLVRNFNLPEDNVLEWELTEAGLQQATAATSVAMTDFYEMRSRGITASKSFYQPDLSKIKPKEITKKLQDISNETVFVQAQKDTNVKELAEKHFGQLRIGTLFYQLIKPEKAVQPSKLILIKDKFSGKIYAGSQARQLIGIDFPGTVALAPGMHGNYDIFIQSTSANRKIPEGSFVIYWKDYKHGL